MTAHFQSKLSTPAEKFSLLHSRIRQNIIRLILLTGNSQNKRKFLDNCLMNASVEHINLGRLLSEYLHDKSSSDLGMETGDFLRNLCYGKDIYVDNVEILFDNGMELDPIMTLKNAARTRLVVVNWPGNIDNEYLMLFFAKGDSMEKCFSLDTEIFLLDESGFTYPECDETM